MNSTLRRFAQAGFTLVELLIVVIILAILAAIVIPQFSSSTTDAQESALDANLSSMRSAIELFKVQHNNVYPGAVTSAGGTCTGGTAGNGAINTAQAWMDHLLMASNATGQTCSLGDPAVFKFGPYLRKGIPNDPFTSPSKGALVGDIVVTSTGAAIVPNAATGGWAVDTKSGQIVMNSNGHDSKWTAASPTLYSSH
jgi:prepilin-type N-terminal cleavage/methylation domain-containing protein